MSENQLVVRETFQKPHRTIASELVERVQYKLAEFAQIKSISTEAGYKCAHESIQVSGPGFELYVRLTTHDETSDL